MTDLRRKLAERGSLVDLFKQSPRDLSVEHDKAVVIDADDRRCRTVELNSFKDLQALNLIPANLDETAARAAIDEDDRGALSFAESITSRAQTGCGCADEAVGAGAPGARPVISSVFRTEGSPFAFGDVAPVFARPELLPGALERFTPIKRGLGQEIGLTYTGVRKLRHPRLSEVLTATLRRPIRFDAAVSRITHGWITRLQEFGRFDLTLLFARDVVVQRNSTLTLGSGVDSLRANDIRIFRGGRLAIQSSYIKIVCNSVAGDLV